MTISKSEFSNIARNTIDAWGEYMHLDPEALSLLQRLQSTYIMGLITNFDHPSYIHELLRVHQLTEFFKVIVISGEIGIDKPDPSIFHHALMETNLIIDKPFLLPGETLYVGDSPDYDVQGAFNAGMVPILLNRNTSEDQPWIYDYNHTQSQEVSIFKPSSKQSNTQPYRIIHSLAELDDVDKLLS
ncbi:MAG: HAD family hydrolase [Promethearchaeota archaeon]